MAWDRRKLAALAACSAAYLSVLSCNGAEFNSGDTAGDSGAGGGAGKANGAGGKTSAGGGKGGAAGNATGGTPITTGGDVNPGTAGDPNPGGGTDPMGGSAGSGGQSPGPMIPKESLVYWFAADVGVTNEDGVVAKWADQSGNGFNAVQLLPQLSPKLTQTGQAPLPFLEFDGADDYLELPEFNTSLSEGLSLFVVAGAGASPSCSAFIELSNGPEINDINMGIHENALQYEIADQVLTGLGNSFPVGEMHLAEAHHAGTPDQAPVELRVNGAQAGATVMALPVATLRISNFIGKSLYNGCSLYAGAIAEIIFYSRRVTAEERADIEMYLMAKWQCCS